MAATLRVEDLKQACIGSGHLYEDRGVRLSPRTRCFTTRHRAFQFQWKRPKELVSKPCFLLDGQNQCDITTGKLGDSWLVSSLGSLYLTKSMFFRVIPSEQSFDDDYCGLFYFRVWWHGTWKKVVIDDRLPTVNNKLVFIQSDGSHQFWAALIEKAFAKLYGSYEALKYNTIVDGLTDLTGGVVETMDMKDDPMACSILLRSMLDVSSLVTCSTPNPAKGSVPEILPNGLSLGRSYRVIQLEKVSTSMDESIQLVRLRNPWGAANYSGAWQEGSLEWNTVSQKDKDALGIGLKADGEFWMPYYDFVKCFASLELVHIAWETVQLEPTLNKKKPWELQTFHGRWCRGVTAGGCRNHAETFYTNPQLLLTVSEADDVLISLQQHNSYDPHVIGFSVYQLTKVIAERLPVNFFQNYVAKYHSRYTNSRQITHRYWLPQGRYVIMPTTHEAGKEGGFTVRISSCTQVNLQLLDDTTAVTKTVLIKAPQRSGAESYENIFLQYADEQRQVDVFCLSQALKVCLPKGNILAVTPKRRIVASWKAEKLREALKDVGFYLSTDVICVIMMRHIRKDGLLYFVDFVSCILQLYAAFGQFNKRDPAHGGIVKMNLSDWIRAAVHT
ncbi:PREDICTED: calpain-C-like [Priapulus caudatus]|uniref:Calpain-C-like n=1 Tax=Priapulus caudatus TaxID=37621 RepID=A0ABM1DVX9_PRICU|nr:PREDICTED: calpain-C-like [Priapulus caudatus]